MSILLDDREDQSLATRLGSFGLPVTVAHLDYGDLAIRSSGGLLIGYERKRLTDLITSMQDRRLSGHQLRNMFHTYDRVELVVEGLWKPSDSGAIEVPYANAWQTLYHYGAGVSYRQVDSYLYSQYECGGVPCWRTGSLMETSHLYASRWHWWQKDYDLHKSHDVLFTNSPSAQRRGAVTLHQGDPNAVTLLAAQIPGLDAKSWDVGKHFKSPYEMCNATEAEWRRVVWTDRKGTPKRFGKATAHTIWSWLRGYVREQRAESKELNR